VQGEAAVCCLAPCLCKIFLLSGSQAQVARGECQVIGLWCIFGFTLTPDITLSHSLSRLPASLGASNDVRQNNLETSAPPHQLGSRNKTRPDPGYWLSLTKDEVVQAIIVPRLSTCCGNTLYP
jgi:hypothetical protein